MAQTQSVQIVGTPTGGNFKLTYAGNSTANIAYNAAPADVQTALRLVSGLSSILVSGANPFFQVLVQGVSTPILPLTSTNTLTGGTNPGVRITIGPTQAAGESFAQKTFPNNASGPAFIQATPVIGTSAYSSGQTVGGMLVFPNVCDAANLNGAILAAMLIDQDAQGVETELWLFNQPFSAPGDAQTWNPSVSDLSNLVGLIDFAIADYGETSTQSICYESNLFVPFVLATNVLYGQLVTRGTPTYTAANHLIVGITGTKN